ncbi:MAG: hypothetical protein H6978_13350 [Gammaproteobacteria bacterium]|nr:hypothetical protein [Gammaproteobacteria bacterium]
MTNTHFAISWIYEEFRACRIQHGQLVAQWIAPMPVTNLLDFNVALVQASEALGMFNGGTLAIAYEADEHAHKYLDLPAMSQRDLERHLELRVDQEKPFDGEAAWSYRILNSQQHGHGALLHTMPARILNAIIRICHENQLTPVRMVPLTDIMAQSLITHQLPATDVVLVVALFDSRVELVVTTGTGEAMFVRELSYHWQTDNLGRLQLDIERTLLYVKQRQHTVGRILVIGRQARTAITQIAGHFAVPVELANDGEHDCFWAGAVAALPNETTTNLIPKSVRRSANSKQFLRAATWIAAASVLCAVAITGWVEYLLWNASRTDPQRLQRAVDLRETRDVYVNRIADLDAKRAELQRLSPDRRSIPAQFIARLGEIVPETALLQRASVSFDGQQWQFSLEGATLPTMSDAVATLTLIEQHLAAEPWLGTISNQWRNQWLEQLRNGAATDPGLVAFNVEGALAR